MTTERKGDWIMTYSGTQFWPLDPLPEDVNIIDIAHALSMICRWTGHTRDFYSVAEHSVHVSNLVHPDHALQALLHDASETYLCDIAKPVKRCIIGYDDIEHNVQSCIYRRFGVSTKMHNQVKDADNSMLRREAEILMPNYKQMHLPYLPAPMKIECMSWVRAKRHFLARYSELTGLPV